MLSSLSSKQNKQASMNHPMVCAVEGIRRKEKDKLKIKPCRRSLWSGNYEQRLTGQNKVHLQIGSKQSWLQRKIRVHGIRMERRKLMMETPPDGTGGNSRGGDARLFKQLQGIFPSVQDKVGLSCSHHFTPLRGDQRLAAATNSPLLWPVSRAKC